MPSPQPSEPINAPVVPPATGTPYPHAPAAVRNRGPIGEVLTRVLPPEGTLLEIACGTGEHAAFLAATLPGWHWRPTEADPAMAAGAAARLAAEAPGRVAPVRRFDVRDRPWPAVLTEGVTAILAINLIHIAPWSVTEALMAGARDALPPEGTLILYGPFKQDGRHTAPSNAAFDQSLRARNPAWGVRDLEAVTAEAACHGLAWAETVAMPANNRIVVFRKT